MNAFSQCDSNILMWQKIANIDTISNKQTLLKKIFELKKTKETCQETSDSVYAKVLHIIGRTYWNLNEINNAIEYSIKSIKINSSRQKNVSERQSGLTYYNLGEIYSYNLHNYHKSFEFYDKCILILGKHQFKKNWIAKSYSTKASIYFSMGDYQKSIENAEKALLELGQENSIEKVAAVSEKIQSLIELRDYKTAIKLLTFYVSIAEKNFKNTTQLANLYSLMGTVELRNNQFEKAKKFYFRALEIHKINNFNNGSAQTLLTIGDLLTKNNKFEEALKMTKMSLMYSNEVPYMILEGFTKTGYLFAKQLKYDLALKTIQAGLSDYTKKDINSNLKLNPTPNQVVSFDGKEYLLMAIMLKAETWLAYYRHTNKKEYLQNALETFSVADKMVDYMRQEHVGYQSKLFWRDKTHSLYENAIEVCYLLKNYELQSINNKQKQKNKALSQVGALTSVWDDKAFYFFEKSRAVLLNDKINNLSANQLLSESDQITERKYQQEISDLNSKINQETNEEQKSKLNVKMLDVQESQQKYISGLATKYPSYYQFKYDTTMYDLGQMKQYLQKSNTSFIEYFKGDSANYQLVIKSTGVDIIKQKQTENLYQYLINTPDLGNRVIVSQDGEFMPLDSLKNQKGEYLLKKYALSNTYSAQYLLRNSEKKVTNSWLNNFIGFAPVNYSKSMVLPSLLGADDALANVSRNYFWPNNYQKEKATKSNFTQKAANYKIIQLFTHADADNVNKEPTIFFADSAMKVSELESFGHFNTELLVLSACKTNVGKVAKGEGTLSMAREFAGLGIPATITTLWSVENEATYQITELFYKYLKKGEPKDVALQKAKLEYLEMNSREKQNPKYWAAFVLMGETAPLQGFDGKIAYIVAAILLLILSILTYFLRRKKPNPIQVPNFVN